MTAKAYLSRLLSIKREITVKLEEFKHIEDLVYKCTSMITDMPRGQNSNSSFEESLTELLSKKIEVLEAINKLELERDKIRQVLQKIKDVNTRTLLELRYMYFKNWQEIEEELGYSRRTVLRKHKDGLRVLDEILKFNKMT